MKDLVILMKGWQYKEKTAVSLKIILPQIDQ